jgi:hypothetical protein
MRKEDTPCAALRLSVIGCRLSVIVHRLSVIGCPSPRKRYRQRLHKYFNIHFSLLLLLSISLIRITDIRFIQPLPHPSMFRALNRLDSPIAASES